MWRMVFLGHKTLHTKLLSIDFAESKEINKRFETQKKKKSKRDSSHVCVCVFDVSNFRFLAFVTNFLRFLDFYVILSRLVCFVDFQRL